MTSRAFFVPMVPVLRTSGIPLVLYACFLAFSMLGYWTFCIGEGRSALLPGGAPSLQIALQFFSQLQIMGAALLLLHQVFPFAHKRFWLAGLGIILSSLGAEYMGVRYGIPFGDYAYTDALGFRILDTIPYAIPLSWWTLSAAAYFWAQRRFASPVSRIAATSLVLLAWDLVLDPAMTGLHPYWIWKEPGIWFGVPLVNMLGWYLSGLLWATFLELSRTSPPASLRARLWNQRFLYLQFAMPVAMVSPTAAWPSAMASLLLFYGLHRISRQACSPGNPSKGFMARNSRSFFFAARFLSTRLRTTVYALYSWCRLTDDLVDLAQGLSVDELQGRLDAREKEALKAYQGLPVSDKQTARLFNSMA